MKRALCLLWTACLIPHAWGQDFAAKFMEQCTKKGQVECYISVIDKKANLYGETHFIQVKTSKKRQTEMYKCGFKPVILGNLQKPGTKKKPRQKNIEDVL